MTVINKKNMGERANQSAASAPTLEDRISHANALANSHPLDESDNTSKSVSLQNGVKMVEVSMALIDQNPFNARKIYRPDRVNELAISIGAHGQDVPGIATIRDGRYILAAGHYRFKALKVLGRKTMALMIHENLNDQELYRFSYRENAEREGQSALDNALAWSELLSKGVYVNETALAEAVSLSLSNVNRTLRILSLSQSVIDEVMEEPNAFSLMALYELALFEGVAGPVESLTFAKLVRVGDAGRKEINLARCKYDAIKPRKQSETSRPYKITQEGVQGTIKEWDSGRVMFDVTFADTKLRDSVMAEMKKRFGID